MRHIHESGDLIVTCGRGAAPMCEQELKELGLSPRPVEETAWSVRGTLLDAMRLNLWLRTAQRVLLPMVSFPARNADELYRGIANEPWEAVLHPDGYFSVTTGVEMPGIRDPRFAALKAKDAIADRMVQRCGRRPDSGGDRNKAVFHLRWLDGRATLCLDTSGEPLSRRGYRLQSGPAPMQEALAAACVLASPWRGSSAFVNPMCGSGTIAIEAALIAANRAPGLLRRNFGFMHVKGRHEEEWKELKRAAEAAARNPPSTCKIIASDISPRAIEAARANAERAGVADLIRFEACDFAATPIPPPPGVVMLNPEYGERMGDAAKLEPEYRRIGDFLKQKCTGYLGYVFTANLPLAKRIGLHSKRRLILYNANLEGRLLEFELYAGTRDPGDRGIRGLSGHQAIRTIGPAIMLALALASSAAHAQTSHVVRAGENMERIARQHGVRVSAIIAANELDRPELLRVGQVLKIPARDAPLRKRYIVEEGDTLGGIARDHGVSPDAILKLNNLADANRLRVGQVLEIPLDSAQQPPAVRYPLPTALKSELDRIPVRPGRWKFIVIHHSATDTGSLQSMDHYHRHRRRMENGLAYHFVIGNGRGMPNGQIAIGRRWRTQIKGGHLASDNLNEIAIGICLVGNYETGRPTAEQMRSLYALTGYLMQRTRNPATAVRTHRQINTKPTDCPGRNFPTRALLENLP